MCPTGCAQLASHKHWGQNQDGVWLKPAGLTEPRIAQRDSYTLPERTMLHGLHAPARPVEVPVPRVGTGRGWPGVTVGSQDSQGLVPQGLQFAPVLLTELLCPLSCVHGFWLAGHSSFHHLPTAERSSKLGQRQQGLRAGAGWWGFAQLCWGTLALLEPQ